MSWCPNLRHLVEPGGAPDVRFNNRGAFLKFWGTNVYLNFSAIMGNFETFITNISGTDQHISGRTAGNVGATAHPKFN